MIKQRVKFTDFNGQKVTEDLYFNMSQLDFTRFVVKYAEFNSVDMNDTEALQKAINIYVKRLTDTKDMKGIFAFLEDLILSSYGKIAPDGRAFIKTHANREEFSWSNAYAQLFEDLFTDEKRFQKFLNGVLDINETSQTVAPIEVVQ